MINFAAVVNFKALNCSKNLGLDIEHRVARHRQVEDFDSVEFAVILDQVIDDEGAIVSGSRGVRLALDLHLRVLTTVVVGHVLAIDGEVGGDVCVEVAGGE